VTDHGPGISGTAPANLATALFQPRRVALVGVSSDPEKNTGRPLHYLRLHGYQGDIVAVNPNRREVQGLTACASLEEAGAGIDQALIMLPADQITTTLSACARSAIPLVTIYSDGFADRCDDQGRSRQAQLIEQAHREKLRILGPNSMGVVNLHNGLILSPNAVLESPDLRAGGISIISQSGSLIGSLLSRGLARGFGFSKLVSVGKEADLGVGEVLEMLIDDPDTSCILLFLESLRGAASLARAARRAYRLDKPVVAYKLGRSALGRKLAASHSGAMTGAAEVAQAFFSANGIVAVNHLESLLEIPPLLDNGPVSARGAVSVLSTTGGGAATVVDQLGEAGIQTCPADPELSRWLASHGLEVDGRDIIDLTMAGTRQGIFAHSLARLLTDPRSAALVVVVGSSGQFHPGISIEPIVNSYRGQKPLAVFILPEARESLAMLAAAGIAAFRTPESCADALAALFRWRAPDPVVEVERDQLVAVTEAALAPGNPHLNELEATRVFAALGIPTAALQFLRDPQDEISLRFPVVVKALLRGVNHKTELGAVELNVADARAARAAMQSIHAGLGPLPDGASFEGYLLQVRCDALAEVLIGYRRDPEVGPLVTLASGGRLAELYQDYCVRPAPVSEATAMEMIEAVPGLAAIRGYRGLPKGDLAALARAITALSRLAGLQAPQVLEAEINPLMVHGQGQGVTAVDALVVLEMLEQTPARAGGPGP